MLDYRIGHTGWSGWLRRNARVLRMVTEGIRANGPMGNGDFESRRPAGARGGWWAWRPVQHALHYLWMTGTLTIHSRRHFQKRFELLERTMPEVLGPAPVSSDEFRRWHLERSFHALGAATEADLSRYLSYPRFAPGSRRAALAGMRTRGEVTEIEVEGSRGPWLVLTRDLPALARPERRSAGCRGTTLLSPFDSLLWHRDRVSRLFGFEYRIEVYTPGPRRVHGYYTLPILHHGHLVGRLDAKNHRRERRLEVRSVHFEPWFAASGPPPRAPGSGLDQDEALRGVADALNSLAAFTDAGHLTLGRVTPNRLRAPLTRLLRGIPSGSSPTSAGSGA